MKQNYMMISTDQLVNYSELEQSFYDKKFYFSYSSLNKLLYCPEIFYKEYILGDKEERLESYFTEGKLIHCFLLQPDKVEEQFATMTTKLPSENAKIVVDRVYAHHKELLAKDATDKQLLSQYNEAIIDVLKDINLYQTLKTDEQRIEKMLTPETVNYWDFLCNSEGKTFVDFATFEKCKSISDKLRNNPTISSLLKLDSKKEWWDTVETHNEAELSMDLKKYSFGLKGIIDNLVIDPGNGVIRINDIKTTSKSLKDFPESIKFYRYDMQAAIYNLLVINQYQDLLKKGFKVEFRFIVIDKNLQSYAFLVSEDTMLSWSKDLQDALAKGEYHYSNKDYTLPYEFMKGVVL